VRLKEDRMRERGVRKRLTGVVVGTKMEKTVVVLVNRIKKHKSYLKYIKRHSKYLVHDPLNRCQLGDKVRIIESRPISKTKRWQVIDVTERAEEVAQENNYDQSLEQEK
jgi:small subunit ribosomal protein S17